MATVSIVLGLIAFSFVFLGVVLAWVPFVGTVFAFLAPLLSLAGIVLAGVALSRAKQEGNPTGSAVVGLILNIVAFLPAIAVALTCGMCNAALSTATTLPRFQPSSAPVRSAPADAQTAVVDAATRGAPPPAIPPPPISLDAGHE